MKNTEIVKEIISKLEENHINLYHDISKSEIEDYISKIENLDSLNSVEFDYEMKKLFALFKDAHTTYYIPSNKFKTDMDFRFIGGKVYVSYDDELLEVKSVSNIEISQIIDKLQEIINYETNEWLSVQTEKALNNFYFYMMLKLTNEQNKTYVNVEDGRQFIVSIKEKTKKEQEESIYNYDVLKDNILYVRYSACKEMESYSFDEFMKDIKSIVTKHNINKYILDIRDNGGGNSEILNPFQEFVKKKSLCGVMLINNGVFSSGRFAVARFKKMFNIPLIGEPTGGASKSYGFNKNLQVEDKMFSVSTRLWDFSDVFGCEGAIQPDIYIPLTIKDLREGKDRVIEKAIEVLNEKEFDK